MSRAADLASVGAGIASSANATAISISATEVVTLLTSALATSEGGAVTTNIAQGLAKAWISLTNAAVDQDSLNISSITDNGTGDYSPQINNNMNNALYACVTSADITDAVTRACAIQERATGSFRVLAYQTHAAAATESAVDGAYSVCLGDLA